MESRYALRELEGVIGLDLRRLEDGRRAVFRHTPLHRRTKRDFFERRDAMAVLSASLMAYAALGNRMEVTWQSCRDTVDEERRMLSEMAFPYLGSSEKSAKDDGAGKYDEYFDELDAIEEAKARERAKAEPETAK